MEEEDICPVDLYVKSRVVKDTILLAKNKHYVDLD
jgi:tmRNA-binding protein